MDVESARHAVNRAYPPYSDMRGHCDAHTKAFALRVLAAFGYTEKSDVRETGVDIVAERDGRTIYVDLEQSKYFHSGDYHSKFGFVSVPIRKGGFFNRRDTYWMCISRDLRSYIVLKGTDVLDNSSIEAYPTYLNPDFQERFHTLGLDKVTIRHLN